MDHRLGMGEFSKEVAHAARSSGQPIPEGCEQPSIRVDLVFFVEAFDTLATCRVGNYIPWTAARDFAKFYSIPFGEDFDFFWEVIHKMDEMEMADRNSKAVERERFREIQQKNGQT